MLYIQSCSRTQTPDFISPDMVLFSTLFLVFNRESRDFSKRLAYWDP